jgi:hypothetical protein
MSGRIEVPSKQDETISKNIEIRSHGIKEYLEIHFDEHIITSPQDFRLLGMPSHLLSEDNIMVEALPGWTYGGNLAAPTKIFLELNGFDEEYDKAYGWIDCDFGVRAYNKGYKSFINTSNWCLEIQDEKHDESPDIREKASDNWKLYENVCNTGKTWANSEFNLCEIRKKILEE